MFNNSKFIDFIMDVKIGLPKLNAVTCEQPYKMDICLKFTLTERLLMVNKDRINKISNINELLACVANNIHISTDTYNCIIFDKINKSTKHVNMAKIICSTFVSTYPMADVGVPAILCYIYSKYCVPPAIDTSIYINGYKYLSWVISEWNRLYAL